jgi:hypothetical protein
MAVRRVSHHAAIVDMPTTGRHSGGIKDRRPDADDHGADVPAAVRLEIHHLRAQASGDSRSITRRTGRFASRVPFSMSRSRHPHQTPLHGRNARRPAPPAGGPAGRVSRQPRGTGGGPGEDLSTQRRTPDDASPVDAHGAVDEYVAGHVRLPGRGRTKKATTLSLQIRFESLPVRRRWPAHRVHRLGQRGTPGASPRRRVPRGRLSHRAVRRGRAGAPRRRGARGTAFHQRVPCEMGRGRGRRVAEGE